MFNSISSTDLLIIADTVGCMQALCAASSLSDLVGSFFLLLFSFAASLCTGFCGLPAYGSASFAVIASLCVSSLVVLVLIVFVLVLDTFFGLKVSSFSPPSCIDVQSSSVP